MALSGNFLTSDSGQGGGNFYGRTVFEWWRTGWGRSGNQGYHDISFTWKSYGGSSGYWQNFYQPSLNVNGSGIGTIGSGSRVYGAGATTIGSGSFRLWTNSAGNASFGASAQGGIYYNTINTSGSGSWALDNIPMHASITGTSGSINDESNPSITYSNPGGGGITAWLELPNLTGSTRYAQRNSYASGANFALTTTERNAIRAAMANVKSTTVRYVIYTNNTGAYSTSDATISIVNANPVFTTITYEDINGTTLALTGDELYIIQGQSTVQVNIDSADKAVAQKSATMVSYTATLNAVNTNFAYSGSTINQTLNAGSNGAATNQTLSVTATDSRGNTTTVQQTVIMVPYSAPVINATAERDDGFGADTTIDVTGTYSVLDINGTPVNVISPTTGVGYKVWEVGDSEPGSYTDLDSTATGGNYSIDTPPIESLDQNSEFNLKVRVTDSIQTVTTSLVIPIGTAAFRIGTDGLLYNNGERIHATLDLYPVGTVLLTTVNTNPQSNLGGTWATTTTASGTILGMTMYGWRRTA